MFILEFVGAIITVVNEDYANSLQKKRLKGSPFKSTYTKFHTKIKTLVKDETTTNVMVICISTFSITVGYEETDRGTIKNHHPALIRTR